MTTARVRTPKGFRRLCPDEPRRKSDRVWSEGRGPWKPVDEKSIGSGYWPRAPHGHWPVIRKLTKAQMEPLDMCHPSDGSPCTYSEWKRAEIVRIIDNDS